LKPEVHLGVQKLFPLARAVFPFLCNPMPAEARVTKMWTQQKGLIPLLFLAFGAYFLFDGFIGYPRSDERWKAHQELKDQPGAWEKLCAERGWKTTPPEKFLGPDKYREQFFFGGGTALIGLISLIYWQRQRKSTIRNDESGISSSLGTNIPYGAITRIDKKDWKRRGFAYVYYKDAGALKKFTLDDAKHDPKALDVILAEAVVKVGPEVVIEEPVAAEERPQKSPPPQA
jgi:hypothetical protein